MTSAPNYIDPIISQLILRRRELGFSASQVSIRCGWNDSLLPTYEAARRNPPPRHLRRWANELGMDIVLTKTGEPS